MLLKNTHKTLYARVADKLRTATKKLPPGSLLDSESRLAKRFGVSVATIREALRLLAAEGRLESRQGKGTVVLPFAGQSVAVLLGLDVLDWRTSRFYPETALAVREALELSGLRARHYYGRVTPENPAAPCLCDEFFEDLQAGKLSGLIALGAFPMPPLTEMIARHSLPSVGSYPGYGHSVCSDVEQFLREGIGYCVAQGRRRIAMLAWNSAMDPEFCNLSQFSRVLAEHGLAARPEWHRGDIHPNLAGAGWESFREIWTSGREKPDAILICDDCLFSDAFQAISDLKIAVPRDLLIVTQAREGGGAGANLPVARLEISPKAVARELVRTLAQACEPGRKGAIRRSIPFKLHPVPSSFGLIPSFSQSPQFQ